jgi:hypothetical protein
MFGRALPLPGFPPRSGRFRLVLAPRATAAVGDVDRSLSTTHKLINAEPFRRNARTHASGKRTVTFCAVFRAFSHTDALNGMGSCCEPHATAGCGNADIHVCVCEKQPSCCEKTWDAACVFIVEQKYCQQGVRECVCGSGMGQWGQTQCCESEWSSTCDNVAEIKCNAVAGCF